MYLYVIYWLYVLCIFHVGLEPVIKFNINTYRHQACVCDMPPLNFNLPPNVKFSRIATEDAPQNIHAEGSVLLWGLPCGDTDRARSDAGTLRKQKRHYTMDNASSSLLLSFYRSMLCVLGSHQVSSRLLHMFTSWLQCDLYGLFNYNPKWQSHKNEI